MIIETNQLHDILKNYDTNNCNFSIEFLPNVVKYCFNYYEKDEDIYDYIICTSRENDSECENDITMSNNDFLELVNFLKEFPDSIMNINDKGFSIVENSHNIHYDYKYKKTMYVMNTVQNEWNVEISSKNLLKIYSLILRQDFVKMSIKNKLYLVLSNDNIEIMNKISILKNTLNEPVISNKIIKIINNYLNNVNEETCKIQLGCSKNKIALIFSTKTSILYTVCE